MAAQSQLFSRYKRAVLAENGSSHIIFHVRRVPLPIVNAVRRAVLSWLPSMALDPATMEFRANTSALNTQFLAHRVSLVPLGFDENQLRVFGLTPGSDNGLAFVLSRKNATWEVERLTTADFKVYDRERAAVDAAPIFPTFRGHHALLAYLRPGEEVHMECTAGMGTGHEHSRWSQVSLCTFRNIVDKSAAAAELERRLEAAGGLTPEARESLIRNFWALDANHYFEENAYEFEIECETRLRPQWLFWKALRVLRAKVEAFKRDLLAAPAPALAAAGVVGDELQAEEPPRVEVASSPDIQGFYQVLLRGEDHTLGNLLQGLLFERWVTADLGGAVSFIGYHCPHPSEDHLVLKLRCAAGVDLRQQLALGADIVTSQLDDVANDWAAYVGLGGEGIVEVDDVLAQQ